MKRTLQNEPIKVNSRFDLFSFSKEKFSKPILEKIDAVIASSHFYSHYHDPNRFAHIPLAGMVTARHPAMNKSPLET